jgi:hypothetical protein
VGKEKEIRLFETLMNSEKSSDQQGVQTGENHRCFLIIGGIELFMPSSSVEAITCVASTRKERQPKVIFMKEEKEKRLKYSHVMRDKEENSNKMLT